MTTNIRVKYKDTRIKQSVKDKNYNNTNNNIKIHIKEGSNETKKNEHNEHKSSNK